MVIGAVGLLVPPEGGWVGCVGVVEWTNNDVIYYTTGDDFVSSCTQ
jgi:hypothetical protein